MSPWRRRLDLALALIGDPDLIFLDEPTTGFDPCAGRAHSSLYAHRRRRYTARVNRDDARRVASALRHQLWSTASNELLDRIADRGGMNVGLNPPNEIEDEELTELVWQAVKDSGLASEDE